MIERNERLRCPKCGQTDHVNYEEVNIEDWAAEWNEETQQYEYLPDANQLSSELVDRRCGRCPDDGAKMEVLGGQDDAENKGAGVAGLDRRRISGLHGVLVLGSRIGALEERGKDDVA